MERRVNQHVPFAAKRQALGRVSVVNNKLDIALALFEVVRVDTFDDVGCRGGNTNIEVDH